ncbi:MAG: YhbY family RNA-binding protein [Candidatus Methanoplasma sp.]|jgi:RNA-binding protein|nr:YhbY family RNA-binding protein [Candidatus Methanoplasma sp.]
MTEKEARKELMRRAKELSPTVHVGKDGVDDGVLKEIEAQLKKARLIKIKTLSSSEGGAKETAEAVAGPVGGVVVDVRGGVVVMTDRRTWDSLCQKKF